jgi:SAM-dependent methyltransferase
MTSGKVRLELGSGTGGLTRFLTSRPFLVASDIESIYLQNLRERYHFWEGIKVCELDLNQKEWTGVPEAPFDTIVASDVLEHIKDDLPVLHNSFTLLQPGGQIVLIVPAGPCLFGAIDAAIGYYRRYGRAELRQKLIAAGYTGVRCHYMNALGVPGWYLNSRLLRRRRVPMLQSRLFNLLIPVQARLEALLHPPFGLSLVAVGRKPCD